MLSTLYKGVLLYHLWQCYDLRISVYMVLCYRVLVRLCTELWSYLFIFPGETLETAGAMKRRGLEREEESPFIILSVGQQRECIHTPQRQARAQIWESAEGKNERETGEKEREHSASLNLSSMGNRTGSDLEAIMSKLPHCSILDPPC